MVYVDKSGNGESSRSKHACLREEVMKMCFPHQSTATFACVYAVCCLPPTPAIEISDKEGEIFKRKEPIAGKVLPTHLFPNNKHYIFSVSEKPIGGLYWNTNAVMDDDWWLTSTFLWSIGMCWFTILLYYVPAPLVLSVILHLENCLATWKITFDSYPGEAFVCSCFCGKCVSLQRKETSLHRGYTGIFSQAPWKEKCYNRSSRAIGVDVVDHFLISYLARVCH